MPWYLHSGWMVKNLQNISFVVIVLESIPPMYGRKTKENEAETTCCLCQ